MHPGGRPRDPVSDGFADGLGQRVGVGIHLALGDADSDGDGDVHAHHGDPQPHRNDDPPTGAGRGDHHLCRHAR